jgi:hypothetical protein
MLFICTNTTGEICEFEKKIRKYEELLNNEKRIRRIKKEI